MKIRGRLPLRDVAGAVDANEEERDAAGVRSLQRAQAMTDGLEPDAEAATEPVHVVAELLRGLEEGRVGHQERAGKVVREPDARQRPRLVASERRRLRDPVEHLRDLQKGELRPELERTLT